MISRENILRFKTSEFFIVIKRSLTILEEFALAVDPDFCLVHGPMYCKRCYHQERMDIPRMLWESFFFGDLKLMERVRYFAVSLWKVWGASFSPHYFIAFEPSLQKMKIDWKTPLDLLHLACRTASRMILPKKMWMTRLASLNKLCHFSCNFLLGKMEYFRWKPLWMNCRRL